MRIDRYAEEKIDGILAVEERAASYGSPPNDIDDIIAMWDGETLQCPTKDRLFESVSPEHGVLERVFNLRELALVAVEAEPWVSEFIPPDIMAEARIVCDLRDVMDVFQHDVLMDDWCRYEDLESSVGIFGLVLRILYFSV